ncbi:NAD(P)H-dependent oxidoreductase [Zunongwangia sp. F260]|uniref:NAD(P)H-dependent oxidoreductase n=1 Tax=Autumnicola lenta TaxID=3075593 RepID=A0ABU3CI16_9FLAO|nr:NAD(P)H-dependent oxidoreductase [Zunongwangia sp. F260]MDT0645992.1 NAD(P)H-dependent oxidoreductase [Zunongwangia sp. F260]
MKKILAFAGSNSSTSINHRLLTHISERIQGHEVKLIKLTEYDFPMYSADLETERGIPMDVKIVKNIIAEHDALIIAVNEHNGTVSSYFKNCIDWLSRADRNFLKDKKILLISTSNGARGAASALEFTKSVLPRFGGRVVESFSFPSYADNFRDNKVHNEVLDMGIEDVLTTFSHEVES